jgi:predicted nucleotidyltransferase
MAEINASVINIVKEFLAQVEGKGIHVESAYLYGSYVKGTANEWSDIDVAVISPDISEDNFDDMVSLTKIAVKIDSRIEPVPFRPEDFVDEDPLVWEIKREGIAIEPVSKEISAV